MISKIREYFCKNFHQRYHQWKYVNYRPKDWEKTPPPGNIDHLPVRIVTWGKDHTMLDVESIYCSKCEKEYDLNYIRERENNS